MPYRQNALYGSRTIVLPDIQAAIPGSALFALLVAFERADCPTFTASSMPLGRKAPLLS